mgnify:CR=1 FL=1
MNGYEIMAASYRQMVKQEESTRKRQTRRFVFMTSLPPVIPKIFAVWWTAPHSTILSKRLSKRLLKMQILTRMQGKKWLPSSVICSMKRRQDRFSMADKARKCKVAVLGSNNYLQVYFPKYP